MAEEAAVATGTAGGVSDEGTGEASKAGVASSGGNGNSGINDFLAEFGLGPDGELVSDGSNAESGGGKKPDEGGKAKGEGDATQEGNGKPTDSGKAEEGDAGKANEQEALIAQLQAQISELSQKIAAPVKEETAKDDKAGKPLPKEEDLVSEYFADDKAYEEALNDPKQMNTILSKVRADATQEALRILPQVIAPLVQQQVVIQTKTAEFYTKNEDLKPQAAFVGFVTNDLVGKNPDWSIDKLFEELPKEVRTRLGLKTAAQKADSGEAAKKPTFIPKGGGGRGATGGQQKPSLTPLEEDIAAMMD